MTLIWDVPLSCPVTQSILSNPHLPKQNLAGSGLTKISQPNHVPDHHCHPVDGPDYGVKSRAGKFSPKKIEVRKKEKMGGRRGRRRREMGKLEGKMH